MFRSFFYYLFPRLILHKKRWIDAFEQEERESFFSIIKISTLLIPVVYIGHYFLVDKKLGLTQDPIWFYYRFGAASVCLICYGLYKFNLTSKFYKIPAALVLMGLIYFQTQTILWYSEVPYLYSFAFILMAVFLLDFDTYLSIGFNIVATLLVFSVLKNTQISPQFYISASAVCFLFTLFMQNLKIGKYKLFLANSIRIEKEREIAESQIEMNDILKKFMPEVLFERLQYMVRNQKKSPSFALDEVLRQKRRQVTILYTDIRAYSKSLNQDNSFLENHVLKSINDCSKIVSQHKGIQRKIGDLLFCYFDYDPFTNVLLSLLSAIRILENEKKLKNDFGLKVRRQIILTFGDATVGNISNINSCLEITAMGAPANLSERIDRAVKVLIDKSPEFEDSVICSKDFYDYYLKQSKLDLGFKKISLFDLQLTVKDFEDQKEIYLLPVTEEQISKIEKIYNNIQRSDSEVRGYGFKAA